jgi:hypothetical protein
MIMKETAAMVLNNEPAPETTANVAVTDPSL